MKPERLSWNEWKKEFIPLENHLTSDPGELMFETYGEEHDFVETQDPLNIWTWVRRRRGDILLSGYHIDNRIGHYVTRNSWDIDTDYEVELEDPEEPTPASSESKFCINCGTARQGVAKFCNNCGTAIA